jgi:broad specificity phosphatase PhoE
MLRPDDTIQVFTSPYRRTRETTEGILRTLTSDDDEDMGPSPFKRDNITVYEEPRLREQDFGNFQPCEWFRGHLFVWQQMLMCHCAIEGSVEMERMWQERSDYGHFFYRIPNGESAADAYDRVSGFNESLWRQFGDNDFPSVCVLVTHGLMTRVFLMKWYHWSVEYFEDLRNINHCEFIVMAMNEDSRKYRLETELRTWSELHRRALANGQESDGHVHQPDRSSIALLTPPSPKLPARKWGGCAMGCNHDEMNYPLRAKRQNTADILPPLEKLSMEKMQQKVEQLNLQDHGHHEETDDYHLGGRDGGGSKSGIGTPTDTSDDDDDGEPTEGSVAADVF